MTYMLLIHEPREQRAERGEAEGRKVYQQMLDFSADLAKQGLLQTSASLQTDAGATRVRQRDGKTEWLDGPFTESKEMIGGFFLLNCDSRQQAMEIAARCPAASWATVEVRQLAPCYET